MKIVWSYSLYGFNKEVYYRPMLDNIQLARANNAQIIIATTDLYIDEVKDYFALFIDEIHIQVYPSQIYTGVEMILRFLALNTIDADFYFVKDSDSIVTERELNIMNHWILMSKEHYMIIRDNPVHISPIMAGMFGVRAAARNKIIESCNDYFFVSLNKRYRYYDQCWLLEEVYPKIRQSAQVYSSYFFFNKEKLIRISRYNIPHGFIGAPSAGNVNPNSLEGYFLSFYGTQLMSLPYFSFFPKWLLRLVYGRVRPSLYLAYLIKRVKGLVKW